MLEELPRWAAGDVIGERYRLETPIGQGGMATVWRAEHMGLRSPVAVKLVHPDRELDEDTVVRFMREAQAAAALRSTHVVQVLDYGLDGATPFLVMELLVGESLRACLARVGSLSPAEVAHLFAQIGRALTKALQVGVVHRDLKPDNLFLSREADDEDAGFFQHVVKVLDFGVAKLRNPYAAMEQSTQTGTVLGTPLYMSPEQARGSRTVDHRSDLWSLGILAYECLLGRRPIEAESLGDLMLKLCLEPLPVPSDHGDVPAGFDAWFARATERAPEARFQTASDLVSALRTVLLSAPAAAPR